MDLNHFHKPESLLQASPELSDRALLGLPETFTEARDLNIGTEAFQALCLRSRHDWIAVLEGTDPSLPYRHAAGQLLARFGDPRLDPFSPQMIDIPGGSAHIGLAPEHVDTVMADLSDLKLDRRWIEKETPCHPVDLAPYRIGRYPVTVYEYREFLRDSAEPRIPENWFLGRYPQEQANHPVSGITAEDADAYAAWLSASTGRAFRLPSEAEWEYAAAGPERFEYPWGNRFLADRANTAEAGIFTTTPVGLFATGASVFGCMDMAGNVEEFVTSTNAPYPGGPTVTDDLVSATGEHRVARGGSFSRFRDLARASRRHGKYPRALYVMGFRLAEEAGN